MEVLIVIGVIAILIGLFLPSLGRVRERARATKSTSNLRQVASILGLYAAQADDAFPVGELGRFYPVSIDGTSIRRAFGDQFEFDRGWIVMVREMAPWDEVFPTLLSPPEQPPPSNVDAVLSVSYVLSRSVMAKPDLWRLGAVPDQRLLRGMRHFDVAFPTSKAVSWDSRMAYALTRTPSPVYRGFLAQPTPVLFADGHVAERLIADATAPIVNVMGQPPGDDRPLHNTPLGVKGRDF